MRWPNFSACFFFQAEDGIRDYKVTGVQTCALPIYFRDWQTQSRSYSAMAMIAPQGKVSVAGKVTPNRASVTGVSKEFFIVRSEERRVGRECGGRRVEDGCREQGKTGAQ